MRVRCLSMRASNIEANTQNVGSGSFPISRPLNLITKSAPTGLAAEFIDYCRSEDVHDLVADLFFVPVSTTE